MAIKQVYRTSDGNIFDTKQQAEKHEQQKRDKQDLIEEMCDLGQQLCILRDKLAKDHEVYLYDAYGDELDEAFYNLEMFSHFKGDTEKFNSSECL